MKPPRWTSRQTGTRDGATTGIDTRQACISRCPGRSTATSLAMEKTIRWFTVSFLVQFRFADFSLAVARFFRAHLTAFAFIILENAINVKHFLRKIAKMLTINHILHEFRFFVTVFLRKIVKTVTFSRKIDKNFKTGVILAHFDFFLKVISQKNAAATVARGPVPRERSTQTKTPVAQRPWTFFERIDAWRGTGPRPTRGAVSNRAYRE